MSDSSRQGRAPTLVDVAAQAGVSRATASLVLRGSKAITPATRSRVEAAMQALGYVYNRNAARLRAHSTHTVGVILPNLTNPFFATLLAGVEQQVEPKGFSVLLGNCNEDPERQDLFINRMRENGVDGFIICPADRTERASLERLTAHAIPLVQILRRVDGAASDFAGVDFTALTAGVVERLAGLGHRRIAFVSGNMEHSVQRERIQGFRSGMKAAGLDASLVMSIPLTHADGRASAPFLMRRPAPPTAILCFNDVVALGLHRGLQDLGLAIGSDVSLVGIDNVAECDLMVPGLASVETGPFRIGSAAGELFLRRLAAPEAGVEARLQESFFVSRPSCGVAPA
ncbi:MAG: LacI family DNA-binding transcriptional regulator [Mesorhizobium sp.]|nr:LacI family DNA-binding transcriptional regulator [Mesorhizobium sp.]